MIRTRAISTLALATALATTLAWAMPAHAQSTADFATMKAQMAAMQAQLDAMRSKVDSLEGQLSQAQAESQSATIAAQGATASATTASEVATKAADAAPKVAWKGAPEFTGKEGWSFKPRGRFHFDNGTISTPGALSTRNLGFNSRVRRIRLGAEGTMPGDFGYKVEVDFANNINFGDAYVSYSPSKSPLSIRLGNFETLDGLEQITSSNNITFLERATFNDAFLNSRRLGAAIALNSGDDAWRGEVGLFTAHSIDSTFDNDGWIGAARLVYAPKALGGKLHLGLNYQHREFASNNGGVVSASVNAPSTNQLARYRARPGSQLTDVRFVDTGSFAAKRDRIVGVEAAAIFKRLYLTGEAQWLKARGYTAGETAAGLDGFSGGNLAVVPTSDPGFFGVYGEIGYFLTGETRGYKRGDGTWSRTKVRNPINKGGSGAFQIAARIDHLDLDDDPLIAGLTNNFATGTTSLAGLGTRLGRGGKQTGYQLGVNWHPIDYVRFMIDYARVEIEGGPLAAVAAQSSAAPIDRRNYGLDVLQTRLQLEF